MSERFFCCCCCWCFVKITIPFVHLGTQGKKAVKRSWNQENGLEMLNQTKICVSEQGSTKVSLFPFMACNLWVCVCVFSYWHVRLLCFLRIWNKRTVSPSGVCERHPQMLPFLHLLVSFNNFSERFFVYLCKMQRQLQVHCERFQTTFLCPLPKVTTSLSYCPLFTAFTGLSLLISFHVIYNEHKNYHLGFCLSLAFCWVF